MSTFQLDFVGIGAAKAGTTWLAACLAEHPQVCVSEPKELNYFCEGDLWRKQVRRSLRGTEWLQARFHHYQTGQLKGEFSPNYFTDPVTPPSLFEHSPHLRLLVALRNPTDALYSYYFELAKRWNVPATFDGFIERYPDALEMYLYDTHLRRFRELFPDNQLPYVLYDDIQSSSHQVLRDLFIFLQIEPDFVPSVLHQRINERRSANSLVLRNIIHNTTAVLNSSPQTARLKNLLIRLGVLRAVHWVQEQNWKPTKFAPMNPDTRARLVAYYAPEVEALGQLVGRDLKHWNC
jgi:hypothetical protein